MRKIGRKISLIVDWALFSISCGGMFISAVDVFFPIVPEKFFYIYFYGELVVAGLIFCICVLDGKTRRAVDAYNEFAFSNIEESRSRESQLTFFQEFFGASPNYPYPALQVSMKWGGYLTFLAAIMDNRDASIMAFVSIFLIVIIYCIRLRNSGWA